MNVIRTLSIFVVLCLAVPSIEADWWSDNGDEPDVQDIDAGAKPETSTDDDLIKDAQGPGQPTDDGANVQGTSVVYDAWGRPYAYGMPYGYGPGFGYGSGFIAGPMRGGRR